MTDTGNLANTDATPTNPVQVNATSVATPTPTEPTTPPVVDVSGMTPAQIDDLAARIEAARANRPPSITDALASLEEKITGTHREKEAAVDTRKAASADADAAVAAIAELKQMMRRTELTEAATVAEFSAPAVVAAALAGKDGDVATLIADAAKSGAYAMKKPATSAAIGGPSSQTAPEMDPGMAALIQEVRDATGR